MIAFYIIISLVFAVFSYILVMENKENVKEAILIAIVMLLLWPVVITAVTVYLVIYRCTKKKRGNLVTDADNVVWDNLKSEDTEETNVDDNNS